MREHLRGFTAVVGLVVRDEPWRVVATTVTTIVAQAAQPAIAFGLKVVTDDAVKGDVGGATRAGVLLALLLGFWSLCGWASFTLRMGFRERCGLILDAEVARLTAGAHGLEHHERPDYLDKLALVRQEQQRLAAVPDSVVINLAVLTRFVLTVLLLGRVHPALLLLVVAATPSIGIGALTERYTQQLQEVLTPVYRLETYFNVVTRQAEAGKELRVFGLGPEFLRRFDEVEDLFASTYNRLEVRLSTVTAAGWLLFGAGFIAALVLVAHQAVSGAATAGDVVLALTLASQVNGQVAGLVQLARWIVGCAKTAGRYQWLAGYATEQSRLGHPEVPVAVPAAIRDGITFDHVSFRYPETDVDVLTDVTLRLPAGTTVAIVGDNGAGKTTLVKLLCRFYDPTAGSITVDGVDVRDIDIDEWRRSLAGGFQDYAKFEFVASEVVGIGDLPRVDDVAAVVAALERAHADEIAATLADGLNTQLGRSFEGGAELSGGQWQKLALGRAMMLDRPQLLVLDEPTAALDAQTEHALFEQYAAAATRTAGITVFVSHRFSTVRMADLIVVVEGGRVTEVGAHAELMTRRGTYAELYELQARAYR
jgi:ATP-binding cassette subfamily B protein